MDKNSTKILARRTAWSVLAVLAVAAAAVIAAVAAVLLHGCVPPGIDGTPFLTGDWLALGRAAAASPLQLNPY